MNILKGWFKCSECGTSFVDLIVDINERHGCTQCGTMIKPYYTEGEIKIIDEPVEQVIYVLKFNHNMNNRYEIIEAIADLSKINDINFDEDNMISEDDIAEKAMGFLEDGCTLKYIAVDMKRTTAITGYTIDYDIIGERK